ncbi:probable glucan 1,3-beta-glucosidase A [Ziziphus jujuba]|uniref:Probable glucan 1,3-beta-glucosidase A n=1 Tax=Ziziphus jujuba TaxID=326968 RepID=A0ABM3ILW4_ZIZJJ|nr:probable glucan 1,3-beta-glucosidase A [Ziziphus jujuba]
MLFSSISSNTWLLSISLLLCIAICACNASVDPNFRVRAVALGGWLVTEGWIKPSLFDGIPNKDFLDGTQFQLKSVTTGKYLSAEFGGGSIIVANRTSPSSWETFTVWRVNEKTFQLRVFQKQFLGLDVNGKVGKGIVAVASSPGVSETFEIVRKNSNSRRVRIKAPNGMLLQAKTKELVTADYPAGNTTSTGWGVHDPSVFVFKIVGKMMGEFQVTNGYGPLKAPQVMREHWKTFIVENDFKFISENGLNTVRIPSLKSNHQKMIKLEYGVKVIIDLHAAPGSQNGWEHSASRDGSQEWGKTDESMKQTVDVIEFLASRYAKHPSLYAVELLNEPLSPGVSVDTLKKFYKAGYDAVRRHTDKAFVIFSNRLGPMKPRELFPLVRGLKRSVIDVHYYSIFTDDFSKMTVQQNIDYIYTNRTAELNRVTTSNGPLTFVGEWVAEWNVKNATKEDYQRFAKAQLEVYGRATFGWSYWTLRNVQKHWSLEWMIKNGYIKL